MRMPLFVRRLLAATLVAPVIFVPSAALGGYRENMKVTSVEIAQLPQFCWAQFEVPNATGDEFRISNQDCPSANHYCPGLIYLIRAKGHVKKNDRLALLGRADTDIRYTENQIKDHPKCTIRDHVAGSRAEVNNLMNLFGFKRPKAK